MTTPREDASRLVIAALRYYADTMPGYAAAAGLTQEEYAAVMVDVRRAREYGTGSWVDLASPETAEALARALRATSPWSDDDAFEEVWKRDAAAILAVMRETGR